MKIKTVLLILIASYIIIPVHGQELFVDKISQDTCLFLGGIRTGEKELKVFGKDGIVFRHMNKLEQVGLLEGEEFAKTLFEHGLYFELEGYEPFWQATITRDSIVVTEYTSEPERHAIRFHAGGHPGFFAMFSGADGNIYGTINYIGLTPNEPQRPGEYNIPEDEESLYDAFLCVRDKIYRGNATIKKRDDL